MSPPKKKSELETIPSMANYLSRFMPILSEINAPLWQILKQTRVCMVRDSQMAFEKMKELITKEPGPVLFYYDPSKELCLLVYVSKSGVLLHRGKTIACTSKCLTLAEENYAQIVKKRTFTSSFKNTMTGTVATVHESMSALHPTVTKRDWKREQVQITMFI